jgi:hypothetical protein
MGLGFARDLGGLLRLCLCEFFLGIERITLEHPWLLYDAHSVTH